MPLATKGLRAYGPRCIHCHKKLWNPFGWPKFCRRCGRAQGFR